MASMHSALTLFVLINLFALHDCRHNPSASLDDDISAGADDTESLLHPTWKTNTPRCARRFFFCKKTGCFCCGTDKRKYCYHSRAECRQSCSRRVGQGGMDGSFSPFPGNGGDGGFEGTLGGEYGGFQRNPGRGRLSNSAGRILATPDEGVGFPETPSSQC